MLKLELGDVCRTVGGKLVMMVEQRNGTIKGDDNVWRWNDYEERIGRRDADKKSVLDLLPPETPASISIDDYPDGEVW